LVQSIKSFYAAGGVSQVVLREANQVANKLANYGMSLLRT